MSSHKTERTWASAIRRAVHRQVSREDKRTRLEAIADKVVSMAVEGDISAINEVGNRLDGKAKQQLDIEVNQRMTIVIGSMHDDIRMTAVDAEVDSRGIDIETDTVLPAPDHYEHDVASAKSTRKHVLEQDVSSGDTQGDEQAQRIARIRALTSLASADTVPVDGMQDDDSGV